MHCSGLLGLAFKNSGTMLLRIPRHKNALFQRLIICTLDETHFLPFLSTHQTTFFNYVIGIFILIVLSRLANLHGVMRGMFPLQVIRYLRGSGVVERLNWEGEVGRGGGRGVGVQGRDKAIETHGDVCYNTLALFWSVEDEKQFWKTLKKAHAVRSCNNIKITIHEPVPRQQAILLFIFLSDHFQEEITSAI